MAQQQERSAEAIRERYGLTERTFRDRLEENWIGYLFILPTFLAFGLLFYFPMLRGIFVTFTNSQLGGAGGEWVGLANYQWLLSNDLFFFAFGWTVVFVLSVTLLQLTIGLLVALVLHELAAKTKATLTALIMSPYFSAPLAGGVIWFWFLSADFGFVNKFLADLGVEGGGPALLSKGIWPYVSLIVAQAWHDYAYAGIIYAAALTSVPSAQYEAAALDGAGRLRRFRDVTVPHLLIPTVVILALRTAWNIAEFAQPFELTAGGPGTKTMLLSILTYEVAFVNLQFGRAFTIGIAMILMSMTAAIIYVTAIKEEENLYV